MVATFTTYSPLHLAWMQSPTACGQVGVYLLTQHRSWSSSANAESDQGETAVPRSRVEAEFVSSHVVRLTVPLAALGTRFSPTEPWLGYSLGYICPPGGQREDETAVVRPAA